MLLSRGIVLHHGSLYLLEQLLTFAGHYVPWHVNVLEFAIEVVETLVMDRILLKAILNKKMSISEEFLTKATSKNIKYVILIVNSMRLQYWGRDSPTTFVEQNSSLLQK